MAGIVLPSAMQDARRGWFVPLQAAVAFCNGPSDEMRTQEFMKMLANQLMADRARTLLPDHPEDRSLVRVQIHEINQ
jgi:hypothetical protein